MSMKPQNHVPESLASKGITASVTEVLRREIILARLTPGLPLRQEEIAERFQVSQIPVREALRTLAGEGLITLIPNRGAIVTALSARHISELIDYRILLESKLLEWALPHLNEVDFNDLDAILVELRNVERSGTDVARVVQLQEAFHRALYRKADRPFFLESITSVRANLYRYLISAWAAHAEERLPGLSHEMLLNRCRMGDTATAVSLLRDHITETGKLILVDIQAKESASITN